MSQPRAKFCTRHKFGKKRKKSIADNCKKRSSVPESSDDVPASTTRAAAAAAENELSLPVPDAPPDVWNSGRVRRDTAMLTPADLKEIKTKADAKLCEIASVCATDRKAGFLEHASDDAAAPSNDTRFVIVSLESVNALLHHVKCKACGADVAVEKSAREYGLAVSLVLVCAVCGDVASVWSSPRVSGDQNVNPFTVNILASRAMQSTGNRQTALNDIFSAMNISHRGLHTKTWQQYLKTKLTPSAVRAANKVTAECASSVRDLYAEMNLGNPGNIAVSYDGTWMTRGHSSHICVGTVIELFSGLVLDFVVLSNFCAACERGPKEDDPNYLTWKENHVCQKNSEKKAGEMEVEAGLILFQRSLQQNNLRYTTVLSDGDSRTFLALQEAKVYGFIPINKEECINHVQKRMGTALRNLVAKHRDSPDRISGKGRLTGDLITKLTSYYGWAVKSHSGDVEAMHKAVMATYHHVTSTDLASNHSLCPTGPVSWCRHNAAEAKGLPSPKHHYNLPPHVSKALLPIYQRLSDRKLLQRCQRGKTQNSNESLHAMIWALAPKEHHASLFSIEAAVAEAVLKFNAGNERASASILRELKVAPSTCNMQRMAEKDRRRRTASVNKRACAENVQQACKKRHLGANSQTDYMPGAY
ncbi:uncharacterized protein LOC144122078 [Amblyomma americanum]